MFGRELSAYVGATMVSLAVKALLVALLVGLVIGYWLAI